MVLIRSDGSVYVSVCVSHQRPSSIQHGLVRQEVFLGSVVTTVCQLVVLNQKAQISHLPDLQLRGFWGISEITHIKNQTSKVIYSVA